MAEQFSTHCYMMPVYNQNEIDNSMQVFDNTVQVSDNGRARTEFTYTSIFNNQHEFIKSAYGRIVSPLINRTADGDSTMVVFGGLQSLKLNEFLLSHTVMQGLISQAAGQLLNSVNEADHKIGSVTFSWFKIDCGSPEVITDVLKTASTSQGGAGGGKAVDGSLVLRELGKGRGMVVPGLWEVEVAGGGDIEAVINHLQKIVPEAADHSAGNAHTVMQLTVTNQTKASQTKRSAEKQAHSAVGTVADNPGVGRITFVLLSNLSPAQQATRPTGSRSSTPAPGRQPYYPWVTHTDTVMKWLESRHASTPFHKSRLLLFLKDVLLRRQKAALVLMLQPSAEQHASNLEWMRLAAQLSADHTALSSMPAMSSHDLSTPIAEHSGKKSASISGDASTVTGTRTALASSCRPPRATTPIGRSHIPPASLGSTSPSSSSRSATPTPRTAATSASASTPGAGAGALSRRGSLTQSRAGLSSSAAQLDRRGSLNRAASNISVHEFSPEDVEFEGPPPISETEKALQVALEASQSEAAALKLAYQYSNDKYVELKATYEELLGQLKEEGAFLVKRDRERFRAALKDLKDYEIYKEVMEAAMVRMQQELETYAAENAAVKASKQQEDRQIKKHKEFNEKYSKDLVATKKKLGEAQTRITVLEKQVKQANKEREVAVGMLAQFKSSGAQQEGHARMQEQLLQTEVQDLQKRLKKAEEKSRALEVDKEAMLASNAAEAASLRAAHSKALEMLMGYQEENDILRSAAQESKGPDALSRRPDSTKRTTPSRNHHQHSSNSSTIQSPGPPPPPPSQCEELSAADAAGSSGRSTPSSRSIE